MSEPNTPQDGLLEYGAPVGGLELRADADDFHAPYRRPGMPFLETKAYMQPAFAEARTDPQVEGLARVLDEHRRSFEEFKQANDQQLLELKSLRGPDVLTEDKLKRVERRMDDLALTVRRMHLHGGEPYDDPDKIELKSAIDNYVRRGRTDGFHALETRGMSVGSEADGGYLVHPDMEKALFARLRKDTPIRALASQLTISTGLYKRPFVISGAGAGWVAETQVRPTTSSPQIAELNFPTHELYACPVATKQLLDDGIIDIEAWLAVELYSAFCAQEATAFITGNGTSQPKGILSYPQVNPASAGFGEVGTLVTGANGGFKPDAPIDCLMDLVHSLPAVYRKNGTFLMNRMTLSAVRRLKTESGEYLYQTRMSDKLEETLMGFPLVECDDMPGISPGSTAIAFADFQRAYLIIDRQGIQILRDPYSAKPYITFYATMRVGGGIADFNAIRLLKFSAS